MAGASRLSTILKTRSIDVQAAALWGTCAGTTAMWVVQAIDEKGEKALALFPAKFQKSMWIKIGQRYSSPRSQKVLLKSEQVDENEDKLSDDDDEEDGLPPLEANSNRSRPSEFQQSDTETDSDADS